MPVINVKDFLDKISQLESSGGKNTDHPMITSGPQQGQQAIGNYGILPNTVRELINRQKLHGQMTQPLQDLNAMPDEDMRHRLEQDPDLQEQLAHQLANKVTQDQMGDEDKAAYSWKMGHNLKPDNISQEQLDKNDYVQKYRRLQNLIQKN